MDAKSWNKPTLPLSLPKRSLLHYTYSLCLTCNLPPFNSPLLPELTHSKVEVKNRDDCIVGDCFCAKYLKKQAYLQRLVQFNFSTLSK